MEDNNPVVVWMLGACSAAPVTSTQEARLKASALMQLSNLLEQSMAKQPAEDEDEGEDEGE